MIRDEIMGLLLRESMVGKSLTIRDIIKEIGCSDGPVRRMLPRLEKEGIVRCSKKTPKQYIVNDEFLEKSVIHYANLMSKI